MRGTQTKEYLLLDQDEIYIRRTYDLAKLAVSKGNHPFAAIAVYEGGIVATAQNEVVTHNDSTKHAELRLASKLSRTFPKSMIEKMVIYTSTEPCVMCAGALYWSGCRNIIFGCSAEALGKFTSKSFCVHVRKSLELVLHKIKIKGPLLEQDGEEIHKTFWNHYGGKK